jgi:adenylate kinase family enzyme
MSDVDPKRLPLSRVNVVGSSGSGKTTFARRLAAQLGTPHIEMDAVFWEPNWTQPRDEVFFERLSRVLAGERWVLDGNYQRTTHVKWARTQTVIWLDFSRTRKTLRVLRRALARVVSQVELWPGTGNRESLRMLFSRDSIVLFAWKSHAKLRERYLACLQDPSLTSLHFVQLRTPGEAERFLARLGDS